MLYYTSQPKTQSFYLTLSLTFLDINKVADSKCSVKKVRYLFLTVVLGSVVCEGGNSSRADHGCWAGTGCGCGLSDGMHHLRGVAVHVELWWL